MTVTILVLIIILILHLAEEITTGFRRRFPVGEMPLSVFVSLNVLIYAFCVATLFLSARGSKLAISFAWIFAIAMLLNGLGHIGIMIVRRGYFPGGFTAFLLVPISGYLITQLR